MNPQQPSPAEHEREVTVQADATNVVLDRERAPSMREEAVHSSDDAFVVREEALRASEKPVVAGFRSDRRHTRTKVVRVAGVGSATWSGKDRYMQVVTPLHGICCSSPLTLSLAVTAGSIVGEGAAGTPWGCRKKDVVKDRQEWKRHGFSRDRRGSSGRSAPHGRPSFRSGHDRAGRQPRLSQPKAPILSLHVDLV